MSGWLSGYSARFSCGIMWVPIPCQVTKDCHEYGTNCLPACHTGIREGV